jgi:hypothetical protein
VVEAKRHKREDRPPDTNNLRCKITALYAKVASKTDQPVAANATEKDHVEVRCHLFLGSKCDDFALEWVGRKYVSICKDAILAYIDNVTVETDI